MDTVSVIIPTYNRASMLPRAIGSVLSQSLAAAEIIVVDDGSTDATKSVVSNMASESDIPIISIKQQNKGPAAARNTGIKQAVSPLLAFLDSDDHWHKDKLQCQLKAMCDAPGYKLSHTREKWYRRGLHLNQKLIHQPPHGNIFEHCLKLCCVGMSTVMVTRALFNIFGYFDESLKCCEDYDFWLRVSVSETFLLVDKQLTIKEGGRSDQVSSIYRLGMDKFRIRSLVKLIEAGTLSKQQHHLACRTLIDKCQVYGKGCQKHGRPDEANFYLRLAQTYCPGK